MDIPSPTCSDGPIWDVWLAAFHAPTLALADELGVFASLERQPATANELANEIRIETRAAESIISLMAALGFLTQAAGRYHLTEVSRTYLLASSPFYWGGFLRRIRNIPIECNKLIESLRRGKAAEEARVSGELWRSAQPAPEALQSFTHAMHAHSFSLAMRVVAQFGLAGVASFLDVAGGSGSYSIAAALQYPQLRCTLLDLQVVSEIAREYVSKFGVANRISVVAGDMFSDVWPHGFERVFFSDIFHDWDDERCRHLAEKAFGALVSGGRVLVHEMLLSDAKDGPLAAAAYSMVMVFVTEGRQRSAAEIIDIISSVGFIDIHVKMTAEGYALIDAQKP